VQRALISTYDADAQRHLTVTVVWNRLIARETRNTFCGTWYLPHSHVHNERTVPIIMTRCTMYAQNGRISTFALKSDVTIMFLNPDFLQDAKFRRFAYI